MTEWTERNLKTLRHLWPAGAPRSDILEALPRKGWDTIKAKAAELGLTRPQRGTGPKPQGVRTGISLGAVLAAASTRASSERKVDGGLRTRRGGRRPQL